MISPRQGSRRVAVTGVGIVCSLGRNADEVWAALMAGGRGFYAPASFDPGGASSAPVAEVRHQVLTFPTARHRLHSFLLAAADEAAESARLAWRGAFTRFGVSIGSANGGMPEAEPWYQRSTDERAPSRERLDPILSLPSSAATDRLAARFGACGPRITNTTACSASAAAIALASDLIRDGEAPGMIAGGGDPLCRLTYSGFASLRLMDPGGCRPFDRERKGLTLGEGAGILVLEEWQHALERGITPLAEILEYGATCDAHHMTACHPEGRGMEAAMREALARSGVRADQVGYVNAHGTATPVNDAAEAKAIEAVFGGPGGPAVSSTKSSYGHLLGGSGAVEAVTAVLCLKRGALPPTSGLENPDPGTGLDLIAAAPRRCDLTFAASNSFGFGGGNVVLLFGTVRKPSA